MNGVHRSTGSHLPRTSGNRNTVWYVELRE
jgi:hypothetical protein